MARLKRSIFRLSMFAAVSLWLGILLSCFVGGGLQVFGMTNEAARSQRSFSLETHAGGLTVEYIPDDEPYIDPDSESFVEFYGWISGPTEREARFSWLIPRNTSPYMTSEGKTYRWELPLVSPAVLLSAVPIIRLVRTRRRRPGKCAECGYDLAGNTSRCPECGNARADSP